MKTIWPTGEEFENSLIIVLQAFEYHRLEEFLLQRKIYGLLHVFSRALLNRLPLTPGGDELAHSLNQVTLQASPQPNLISAKRPIDPNVILSQLLTSATKKNDIRLYHIDFECFI